MTIDEVKTAMIAGKTVCCASTGFMSGAMIWGNAIRDLNQGFAER